MALDVGSRLAHYDVTALIGEGGMDQVYQATDTTLNRQVALKILSAAVALVWCVLSVHVVAQTDADRAEAAARGFDGSLEDGHFAVFWRTEEGSSEQVRELITFAEASYSRLSEIVGNERTPTQRVVLVLAGAGQAPDGRVRFPNVDDKGRVILVRFGPDLSSYRTELTHELVHAFRRHSGHWLSGFLEEGFAEALTMEAEPDDTGFPRYGYPLAIVAGHLLARDEYIPLSAVRDRHEDLNRRCQLQAYIERAAFFDYLKDRGGLAALLELAYRSTEPTDDDYARLFGRPFAELVSEWETALLAAYNAITDADRTADRYRAHPAIAARRLC